MRATLGLVAGLLAAGCLGAGPNRGEATSPSLDLRLEDFISASAGLDNPVFLTHAGDGSGRLFIVEQDGIIKVWKDGRILSKPFLDLASGGSHPRVLAGGERGLLGLAFHPDYATNGRFFVYYTANPGDVTIAEFANDDPADDEAEATSEQVLLTQDHRKYANHNGGMLAFGPDGYLYAGIGDGGSGGDPDNNAQSLDTLLGKIIRLDVDTGVASIPYTIPPGNPFTNRAGRDEIWAYGLRNPWRFSFDHATGDLWIGDVGQNAWEEINRAAASEAGVNYGWSRFEGTHLYNGGRQAVGALGPVAEYGRNEGGASHCSVTGGYVYRGSALPRLQGTYLFGDFCSGFIWTLTPNGTAWSMARAFDTNLFISSFGEDEAGELYVVDHGGEVRRIVAT